MAGKQQAPKDIEVEWQLDALDLRPVERWLAARIGTGAHVQGDPITGIEVVPGQARRLVDVYVDTDDWRIGRSGYVLRVRRRSGRAEATLKDLSTATAGLRRRLEVTQPLPPTGLAGLDPTGPVGRRVHALAGGRRLMQVLEVRTRRRPYDLAMHGEAVAEVALDDTVISLAEDRRRLRLQRVEVEVLPAWVDALQPLVERMRRDCGLQPATLSKFEAGLMAAGLTIPGGPEFGPTHVTSSSSIGEVAYAVLRKDAAAMLAHEPGTRLGEDIEALHQMRVATRRMRAALDLFADMLPVRAARLRAELGWVAAMLGDVRDLDIQLGRFDDWTEEMPGDHREALDELADLLTGHREVAREALLEALDSRRYERMVSGLAGMLDQGPSRRSAAARQPAVVAMPELIGNRHRAAVRAARRAKRSGVATDFHRLRIRCKRLRYSLEFASGIYDGGETKRFVRLLAKLQDELGSMQDAQVASMRLRQLAMTDEGATLSRPTVFAMGGVAERYRNEAERLLSELPGHVRVLRAAEWRRVEAMMEHRRDERLEFEARALAERSASSTRSGARAAGRARPALPHLGPAGRRADGAEPFRTVPTATQPDTAPPGVTVAPDIASSEGGLAEGTRAESTADALPGPGAATGAAPEAAAEEASGRITPIHARAAPL